MKIDYNWNNPPKRGLLRFKAWRWFIGKITYGGVPNHMSDHYNRDHFWPDPDEPPTLF